MSDSHPADDTLGPLLDALGTLYGPETMLRRCHEKFADDPTVIAELRYELEATRELLEGDRVEAGNLKARIWQLEAVRDRLARERDHQTDRADALQRQLAAARTRIREVEDRGDRLADLARGQQRRRADALEAERDQLCEQLTKALEQIELAGWERGRCDNHTLTGDIACTRAIGHNGAHVGGSPSIAWFVGREDEDQPAAGPPPCGNRQEPYPGVACQRPAGHDGQHFYEHGDKGVAW